MDKGSGIGKSQAVLPDNARPWPAANELLLALWAGHFDIVLPRGYL